MKQRCDWVMIQVNVAIGWGLTTQRGCLRKAAEAWVRRSKMTAKGKVASR